MCDVASTKAEPGNGASHSTRAWRALLSFGALFACASFVTAQAVFPPYTIPAHSSAAGVGIVFIACVRHRQCGYWFIAVALSVFMARILSGLSVTSSLVVAPAVGVEGLLFRYLLWRLRLGRRALRFERGQDIPRVLGAATVASLVGGALITGVLGYAESVPLLETGLIRAAADLTGIVTVAPLAGFPNALRALSQRRRVQLATHCLLVLGLLHIGFNTVGVFRVYTYLPLAALLFVVVRCGRPAAMVLPILWAPVAVMYTRQGLGPWSQAVTEPIAPVLGVQLYNLTAFATAWLVAALQEQRAAARAALQRANLGLEARVAERTAEMTTTIAALHEEQRQRKQVAASMRALFDRAASIMLFVDPETGRVIDANAAAVAYYGWSREELRTRSIQDINILGHDEVEAEMSRARRLRSHRSGVRHRRAGGDVRDVEVQSSPITLDGRTLLQSVIHDVTEAKQAERALLASEERFRRAFDGAPVGMAEISLDPRDQGRYLRVNPAFCDLVGYSAEELLAMRAADVTHPADQSCGPEHLNEENEHGAAQPLCCDKRYIRKDGRVVWALITASVLRGRHGRRYGLEHILDVTQRRESQALIDLVFEMCIDPLGIADFKGYLVRVNPAWERALGFSAHELTSRPFVDFVHPDDRERTHEAVRALRRGDPVVGFENQCRDRDGRYHWFEWSSAPLVERGLAVASARDVTARKQDDAELARRALHDALTGLPNRHLFHDRLLQALRAIERTPGMVALCCIDLDRFKDINDSLGHEAGDQVLTEVGRRLCAAVRAVDTVARLAGDEFVVVCPDIKARQNLTALANRLVAALSSPFTLHGSVVEMGGSVGLAITDSHATPPEQLLREADIAMYEAKRRGRCGWALYDPKLQHHALRQAQTRQLLRDALENGSLCLHYQPIVDLANGRIVGAEALLRLVHPTRGLLTPHEFIDIAEESDVILPIGEWVLGQACRQAAEWNQRFGPFHMSVNVSGRQTSRRVIADQAIGQLRDAGLDPACLCLEVTERVLIDSGSVISRDLRRLTDLGVHLALDDFGTGYSSLTYLKRFPIDTVKIDRSFIADLASDPHDSAIVKAVTGLAHNLGLATVAEGVEHPSQVDGLRAFHCQRAQGFLFSHPLPAEDLTRLLEVSTPLDPTG